MAIAKCYSSPASFSLSPSLYNKRQSFSSFSIKCLTTVVLYFYIVQSLNVLILFVNVDKHISIPPYNCPCYKLVLFPLEPLLLDLLHSPRFCVFSCEGHLWIMAQRSDSSSAWSHKERHGEIVTCLYMQITTHIYKGNASRNLFPGTDSMEYLLNRFPKDSIP